MVKVGEPQLSSSSFASCSQHAWDGKIQQYTKQILLCQLKSYTPVFYVRNQSIQFSRKQNLHDTPNERHVCVCANADNRIMWCGDFYFKNAWDSKIHFVSFDLVSSVIILWKIVFTWTEVHTQHSTDIDFIKMRLLLKLTCLCKRVWYSFAPKIHMYASNEVSFSWIK